MKNLFQKILTSVTALTVIAAPVNAGLRENYQQHHDAEVQRVETCLYMDNNAQFKNINTLTNKYEKHAWGYYVDLKNHVWGVYNNGFYKEGCKFQYEGTIGKTTVVRGVAREWHYEGRNLVVYGEKNRFQIGPWVR